MLTSISDSSEKRKSELADSSLTLVSECASVVAVAQRSAEWQDRAIENYVRDRLYRETEGKRGVAAKIVKATGLTSAHISNARRGITGVGPELAGEMAIYWGLGTRSGLEAVAFEWYAAQEAAGNVDTKGTVPQPVIAPTESDSEPPTSDPMPNRLIVRQSSDYHSKYKPEVRDLFEGWTNHGGDFKSPHEWQDLLDRMAKAFDEVGLKNVPAFLRAMGFLSAGEPDRPRESKVMPRE